MLCVIVCAQLTWLISCYIPMNWFEISDIKLLFSSQKSKFYLVMFQFQVFNNILVFIKTLNSDFHAYFWLNDNLSKISLSIIYWDCLIYINRLRLLLKRNIKKLTIFKYYFLGQKLRNFEKLIIMIVIIIRFTLCFFWHIRLKQKIPAALFITLHLFNYIHIYNYNLMWVELVTSFLFKCPQCNQFYRPH